MAIQFSSPGAAFSEAFQKQLMVRMALERQQEMDELERQKEARMVKSSDAQIEQGKAATEIAGRAANRADDAFGFTQANTIVDDAGADTALPEGAAGDNVLKFRPERVDFTGAQLGSKTLDMPVSPVAGEEAVADEAPMVVPGVISQGRRATIRPGFKHEQREATEAARKETNEANIAARKEALEMQIAAKEEAGQRADELKAQLMALNAGFRQQGLDIQRAGLEAKQTVADEKKEAERIAKENAGFAQKAWGDSMLETFDRVLDADGNMKNPSVTGPIQGSVLNPLRYTSAGQDTRADLTFIADNLTLKQIGDLKAQSRTGATGFGALSERELSVIENAASKLRLLKQSDAAYGRELKRIRDTLIESRARQEAAANAEKSFKGEQNSTPTRIRYDMNGDPIKD